MSHPYATGAYSQPPTPTFQPLYVNAQGQPISAHYSGESAYSTSDGNTFILNPVAPSPSMSGMTGNRTTPHMMPVAGDPSVLSGMSSMSLYNNQFPSTVSLIPMNSGNWQLAAPPPVHTINQTTNPPVIPNTASGSALGRSQVVDPLRKTRAEEAAALKARSFMRQRYRKIGIVMLLFSTILLALVCPIVYYFYYQIYEEQLSRYYPTNCAIVKRAVEAVEFHDLCPPTTNYRYYFTVAYDTQEGKIPVFDPEPTLSQPFFPDHPALRQLHPPHPHLAALASSHTPTATLSQPHPDTTPSAQPSDPSLTTSSASTESTYSLPLSACTGAQLSCYTGETETGYRCSLCEPNSVEQCHKHVSLVMNDFPSYRPDTITPCWVYIHNGKARVFLENPSAIIDYPHMIAYWIFIAGIAGIFLLIALYYLIKGDPCRRPKQRLPRAMRPKHAAKLPEFSNNSSQSQSSLYQPPTLPGDATERSGKSKDPMRVRKDRTRGRGKSNADSIPEEPNTIQAPVTILSSSAVDLGDGVMFDAGLNSSFATDSGDLSALVPQPQLMPGAISQRDSAPHKGADATSQEATRGAKVDASGNAAPPSQLARALLHTRSGTPNGNRTPGQSEGSFDMEPVPLPSGGKLTPLLLGRRRASEPFVEDEEEDLVVSAEASKKQKKESSRLKKQSS